MFAKRKFDKEIVVNYMKKDKKGLREWSYGTGSYSYELSK